MDWHILLNSERPRQTTSNTDHRSQFERDFDRAVFSTPLKRLQDKAQVFPLEPHDAVRTRLTHSLEVSSVARGLATAVAKWLVEAGQIDHDMSRSIEAIAATCGLIHDLGNPPFGHAGEDAIRDWFSQHEGVLTDLRGKPQLPNDFMQFEGNAQSLRLVTKLQILADFNGLNLTYATLSAALKYTAPSHLASDQAHDHAQRKTGFFASENALVDTIRHKTGTGSARNPLTFLVEAADDIVYSVADVEDAIKKGILTWREVVEQISIDDDEAVTAALERAKGILGVGSAVMKSPSDDVRASAFRTAAIGVSVEAATKAFQAHYEPIMKGEYPGDLISASSAGGLVKKLKKLGVSRVYSTPPTLKLELMGRRVIADLMNVFWEGVQNVPPSGNPSPKTFGGKAAALLSENYRLVFQHSLIEQSDFPETYHRLHLLTDYICGMTDSFAKRLHAELSNGI